MDVDYILPTQKPYFRPLVFSCTHVALFEYVLLVSISMKKDLTIFIKMGSLGAICVTTLITFVVIYGFIAIATTDYKFDFGPTEHNHKGAAWVDGSAPTLLMYNAGGSALAGVLCAGYFIHQCSLPIIEKAEHPEKNNRNVFLGYCMVFLSYIVVGVLGYFAFTGERFEDIYKQQTSNIGYIE